MPTSDKEKDWAEAYNQIIYAVMSYFTHGVHLQSIGDRLKGISKGEYDAQINEIHNHIATIIRQALADHGQTERESEGEQDAHT